MKKLKQWDKKLAQALERVGRGKKLVFNLVLCALIGALIWMRLGWPLPTMEMEFRRMERTHLLSRSEIVFSIRAGESFMLGEQEITARAPVMIGIADGHAAICTRSGGRADSRIISLKDGTAACLVPGDAFRAFPSAWESGTAVLVLGVPEGAASGEISLEAQQGGPMTGPGCRLGKGAWLFAAKAKGNGYSLWGDVPYTLELYRADGSLLLEHSGALGE